MLAQQVEDAKKLYTVEDKGTNIKTSGLVYFKIKQVQGFKRICKKMVTKN